MAGHDHNQPEHGCPLRFQTGQQAVKNFDLLIERMPPDQRAAFEDERAKRAAELERYVAISGYHS